MIENIEIDVDFDFIKNLWDKQNGLCYYTGIKMVFSGRIDRFQSWDCPSLDRKDPSKGYTKNNLCWCIFAVNSFKNSLTEKEFFDRVQQIRWWKPQF